MPETVGDSGETSPSSDELLARGQSLLERLSREAEAARAEARRAELEEVLVDARRRGDSEQLKAWLQRYDQIRCDAPAAAESPAAVRLGGWEALVPAARQRLEARAQQLKSGVAFRSVCESPLVEQTQRSEKQVRLDAPHAEEGVAQGLVVKGFGQEQLDDQQQLHRQLMSFSRRRGVLASILFHLILIGLLALMTIKRPLPPASLAFESSASDASEPFELSEPMEVAAPLELSETVATTEMSVELPESLSDVGSLVTATLTEATASPAAGLASAAMAAMNPASPAAMRTDSSFFGADASGNCFCYVIDSSASMRGGAWEAAKGELLRSLGTLKENQRFYILFFSAQVDAIPLPGERAPAASALYATQENLEHARRWIDSVRIERGAPPTVALKMAVELEPDAIYLLTDGVTKVDVPKYLREFNRISDLIHGEQVKVPIHAIAYYSLEGEQLMRQIAAENTGQFIYVPDPRKPRN